MNKLIIFLLLISTTVFLKSQVGINTDSPQTTLDVRAVNPDGALTSIDGVTVPRVSDLSVSGIVNGQMVYLIANNGAFTKGFHYWSGTEWLPLDTNTQDGDAWGVTGEDQTSSVYRSGNISVGTTATSTYKLNVNGISNLYNLEIGNIWGDTDWAVINYKGANSSTGYSFARNAAGRTILNTPTGETLDFRRNNLGVGIFDNNGNFGIGNFGQGSTTAKLDVDGSARFRTIPAGQNTDELLTVDASGYVRKVASSNVGNDGDAWGVTGEDVSSNVFRTGNVGIGTTAAPTTYKLDVNGDANFSKFEIGHFFGGTDWTVLNHLGTSRTTGYILARDNGGRTLFNYPTGSTMEFRNNNTVVGLFDTNGNLGVGTISPNGTTEKLDVRGNGKFTGSVTATSFPTTSDARLKKNVSPYTNGLSTVLNLNAVEYDKKQRLASTEYDHHEIGFIAQEVEKLLPQIVHSTKDSDGKEIKTISYIELIPVLTKAIQEQQLVIDKQQQQIEELIQKIEALNK